MIIADAAAKRRNQTNDIEPTTYKAEYEAVKPRRPSPRSAGRRTCPRRRTRSTKHRDDFKPFKFGPFPKYEEAPVIGPNPNKTVLPHTYSQNCRARTVAEAALGV